MKIDSLGCRQQELLYEAARRWLMFGRQTPSTQTLETAWTGLGSTNVYSPALKAGLMTYVHEHRNPKWAEWWKLTPAGIEIVQEILDSLSLEEITKRAGF